MLGCRYSAYCEAMRDRSILDYPEHAPQWGAPAEHPGSAPAGEGPGGGAGGTAGPEQATGGDAKTSKRSWKGWGASKVQKMKSKYQERKRGSGSGSQDGSAAAGLPALPAPARGPLPASLGASPASPAALMAPAGVLGWNDGKHKLGVGAGSWWRVMLRLGHPAAAYLWPDCWPHTMQAPPSTPHSRRARRLWRRLRQRCPARRCRWRASWRPSGCRAARSRWAGGGASHGSG